MKSTLDCVACVFVQAVRAARLATEDPALQRRILDEVARRIPAMDMEESPAVLSLCAYEQASALSGNLDPYRALRAAQNAQALELEPELRQILAESADPLDTALHLAAVGNVIDLGTMHSQQIDVRAALAQVLREGFAVDHTEAFRAALAQCQELLFFLDNAGEIVFDKLLIEELAKHTAVTAVVKGAPILNDAIREDAERVGLTSVCEVIDTGGALIGAPVHLLAPATRARMDGADIILGKGQGNYETLDVYPGNVFLILRAKCEIIAQHIGCRFGQVALISTRARAEAQA